MAILDMLLSQYHYFGDLSFLIVGKCRQGTFRCAKQTRTFLINGQLLTIWALPLLPMWLWPMWSKSREMLFLTQEASFHKRKEMPCSFQEDNFQLLTHDDGRRQKQ